MWVAVQTDAISQFIMSSVVAVLNISQYDSEQEIREKTREDTRGDGN
jgi:hypothetical protein